MVSPSGVFEIVRVVGRGLVSIAKVHAIVAGAHHAQGEPEMARDRFGLLERHGFVKIVISRVSKVGRRTARDACGAARSGSRSRTSYRRGQPRSWSSLPARGPRPSRTASHLPRLEDLDGLDIRFLAPAASTAFGQRTASRPLGAAVGRHALGPELVGRVRSEVDHHAMAVYAAHAGALVQLAVLVDSPELDAHAAP